MSVRRVIDASRRKPDGRWNRGSSQGKWTPIDRSREMYCRINGRSYRLEPLANKQWRLQRIAFPEDQKGIVLGVYGSRREATKALKQLAYRPEPRA